MRFGPRHYVPVLKAKRGEKKALGAISSSLRAGITPLLEIVERNEQKGKTLDGHLDTAFRGLADAVRPYPKCFLDLREMAPDGADAATRAFDRAAAEGIVFTPVTGISRLVDVGPALRNRDHGIALRLTREEFEAGVIAPGIEAFLGDHNIAAEKVDLIIDLGGVENLVREGVAALAAAFMAVVPDQRKWRTLTLSGCAFPKGMGIVGRDSHAFVERAEWIAWREDMYTRAGEILRVPSYSDCAIQHPVGVEGFDFRFMQVSASVRYTLSERWLLMKGESTKAVPATVQFPALAARLVYGQFQPHFGGAGHCAGCASMKDAADGVAGLGSPEVWRRLGTVHHVTTVAESLASLASP